MGKKIKTWSITDVVVMTLSAMKEHISRDKECLVSTTEEQRRYEQKDQDSVRSEFSGNDIKKEHSLAYETEEQRGLTLTIH